MTGSVSASSVMNGTMEAGRRVPKKPVCGQFEWGFFCAVVGGEYRTCGLIAPR